MESMAILRCVLLFLVLIDSISGRIHGRGTITPNPNFDAGAAAHHLKRAMSGWGTDEKTIIKVFTQHNLKQRKIIAEEFERRYDEDLSDDIEDETGGWFGHTLLGMLDHPLAFSLETIHEAMAGLGTDERTLIAVLASQELGAMTILRLDYQDEYDRPLEVDIRDDIQEDLFEQFLLTLVKHNRHIKYSIGSINYEMAEQDAQLLAGKNGRSPSPQDFNRIFAERAFTQLNYTFHLYKQKTGYDITHTIARRFKGYYREGLEAVVLRATDPIGYYVYWLHYSMDMAGTDENLLSWILVTRSEIDLAEIEYAYDKKYGSLKRKIKDDTSSDYERLLISILSPSH